MNASLARTLTSSCSLRTTLRSPATYTRTFASPLRTFSSTRTTMTVGEIKSFEDFSKLIESDKVIAIDFWATWCGPCKMISPMFEKFAAEAPADKIAFYKVDVDDQEQISQEVGIKAMPTFVFFKNGQKLGEVVGAVPQKLQAAIAEFQTK